MIKSRNELNDYLYKFIKIAAVEKTKKTMHNVYESLLENHNISQNESFDIMIMKRGLDEFSDFYAYALLEVFDNKAIPRYFTQEEIKNYANAKIKEEKIELPYTFKNMVQINEEQWIGKTTISELMKLRSAHLINYNENTQRTLTKIINNETESYMITINKAAVSAIKESYEKNIYIPNTITLNIPQDAEFKYMPDGRLVVKKLEHFDIIDGYHRFIAMSQIYDLEPKFDYAMELRIVNFEEDKARQFIHQEDQKTKMKKIDADSFDQYSMANIVVKKLNETSILSGKIVNNRGIINAGSFSTLINQFYFKGIQKSLEQKIRVEVTKRLKMLLECLVDSNIRWIEKPWTNNEIAFFVILSTTNIDVEDYDGIINYLNKNGDFDFYLSNSIKKSDYDRVIKKAGEYYV